MPPPQNTTRRATERNDPREAALQMYLLLQDMYERYLRRGLAVFPLDATDTGEDMQDRVRRVLRFYEGS